MIGLDYRWIRDRRSALGMTQQEAADRAGISRNYLSQLERGIAANPTWSIVQRLTRVLGKETFDQPERRFLASCYLCGIRTDLEMLPHRKDGRLVGWIFSCVSCAPSLYGTDLVATIECPEHPDSVDARCEHCRRIHGLRK